MEKFTITFNEEERVSKYLAARFHEVGVEIENEEKKDGKTTLTVACDKEDFRAVVSDVLTVHYKSDVIMRACKQHCDPLYYYAYVGALTGGDFEGERQGVEACIPDEKDVNLEGIFRFLLTEYDVIWRRLGLLGEKLLSACLERADVYALILYFLGNGKPMKRTLIVDNTIYYDDTNEDMPAYFVTGDTENDIAFNLMLRRPQEIIVPMPKKYSDKLIDLISYLGA